MFLETGAHAQKKLRYVTGKIKEYNTLKWPLLYILLSQLFDIIQMFATFDQELSYLENVWNTLYKLIFSHILFCEI